MKLASDLLALRSKHLYEFAEVTYRDILGGGNFSDDDVFGELIYAGKRAALIW